VQEVSEGVLLVTQLGSFSNFLQQPVAVVRIVVVVVAGVFGSSVIVGILWVGREILDIGLVLCIDLNIIIQSPIQ
jgi:hypothetical protein